MTIIVESGWNVWVWVVGVVSRRRVWLVGEGGIYGCGCKEVYRFPHTTFLLLLYLFFFTAASLLFVHFVKCFSFLFQCFFVITFYVLKYFSPQYKHIPASHGSHMKAAHTVSYMKKHTQTYASYAAMDISCMSVV